MSDASDDASVDFEYEVGDGELSFVVDEGIYPRDAVYGAAYIFIDKSYVFLTRPGDAKIGVRLRSKEKGESMEVLDARAGEFANELLNQVMRFRIGESTSKLRELYMQRAFFGNAPAPSTIDQLLAELDEEELADDPLEISVPWDEPAADESEGQRDA